MKIFSLPIPMHGEEMIKGFLELIHNPQKWTHATEQLEALRAEAFEAIQKANEANAALELLKARVEKAEAEAAAVSADLLRKQAEFQSTKKVYDAEAAVFASAKKQWQAGVEATRVDLEQKSEQLADEAARLSDGEVIHNRIAAQLEEVKQTLENREQEIAKREQALVAKLKLLQAE